MTLRGSLEAYRRDRDAGRPFPGERSTTAGLLTGDGGRLVHVRPGGRLRDHSFPLSGLYGVERARFGLRIDGETAWFDDLPAHEQRYRDRTRLVDTEHEADGWRVRQTDLTAGGGHLTRIRVRDAPAGADLVVAATFAPDGTEDSVGRLVHDGAVEFHHDREHDYLASSTGLADVAGRPADFATVLGDDRIEDGDAPDERLSGSVVCTVPLTGDATDGAVRSTTLATVLADRTETGRAAALDRARRLVDRGGDRRDLAAETARFDRKSFGADLAPDDRAAVRADLRVLAMLRGATGGRVAGPEFDPTHRYSGGYGFTWFRDDAEISRFLLGAEGTLGLDLADWHADSARLYCETQREDGTWPHRVWPHSGRLAPGWANGHLRDPDDGAAVDHQIDQDASAVASLATYLRDGDPPPDLADRVERTVRAGIEALTGRVDDGLPVACQNAWEDATGRFTHTAATVLHASAAVADAPVAAALRRTARETADAVAAALDRLWCDRGVYARRLDEGEVDDRLDASTLVLPGAHAAYVTAGGSVSDRRLDRLARHVDRTVTGLARRTDAVEGLVRYEGDDWRSADQDAPKIWTLATGLGALGLADTAALAEAADAAAGIEPADYRDRAADRLAPLRPDGALSRRGGYLPEQVFDDGRADSATPLGWSHALRLAVTVRLANADDADAGGE